MRPAKCEAEAKAEARYHKAKVEAKAKKMRGRGRTLWGRGRGQRYRINYKQLIKFNSRNIAIVVMIVSNGSVNVRLGSAIPKDHHSEGSAILKAVIHGRCNLQGIVLDIATTRRLTV